MFKILIITKAFDSQGVFQGISTTVADFDAQHHAVAAAKSLEACSTTTEKQTVICLFPS